MTTLPSTIRLTRLGLVALVALTLSGCKREQRVIDPPAETPPVSSAAPFRVTGFDLGNAIDAGKRISSPTSTFAPGDTIYAAILSDGSAPSVQIVARWSFEDGRVVSESTQTLAAHGPVATEFHLANPSGLPAGRYKVEVTANGAAAASREFEVK